jgi:hypothetical protein
VPNKDKQTNWAKKKPHKLNQHYHEMDPDLTLAQLESVYNDAPKSYDELCEIIFAVVALYIESSSETEEFLKYIDT